VLGCPDLQRCLLLLRCRCSYARTHLRLAVCGHACQTTLPWRMRLDHFMKRMSLNAVWLCALLLHVDG
jgi:hypothetical protein